MDQELTPGRPSPGLNMEHGFLRHIEHNQLLREKQGRVDAGKAKETAKLAKKMGLQYRSSKPSMEIYRPPSLRSSGDFTPQVTKSATNVNSEELSEWFQHRPSSSVMPIQPTGLSKSRSTTSAHRVHFQVQPSISNPYSNPGPSVNENSDSNNNHKHRSSNGGNSGIIKDTALTYGLSRSKSLGAGDMKLFTCISQDLDITCFNVEVQSAIKRALEDPNKLPARQLMEIVRHLFNKVLESVRYAEPTAKLCIAIIEKERNETFLESLLNSCREWYNERDRLFSGNSETPSSSHPPMKPSRWVAYVTFLYELYTRLKSKKKTPMVTTNLPPAALILTLLSECCLLFLKPASLMGHSEIECLFIVLTSIGRDLRNDFPLRMQALMSAVREAFLVPCIPQAVKKTLLQLIELNASNWQLMAPAVTYYYPMSGRE